MATPVHVQNSGIVTSSGTSLQDPTGFTVTSGNMLTCQVAITNDPRTITVSDDAGNTWVQICSQAGSTVSSQVEIWACYAPAAGATKVTVSVSGTSTTISFVATEWQYADAADASSTFDTTSTTTTINSAAVGAIDTTTDVAVVFVTNTNFSQTVTSFASGFTRVGSGAANAIFGYRVSSGALTDERAAYTISLGRTGPGAIASFKDTAAGAAGPVFGRGCTFDNSRIFGGSIL